MPKHLQDLFSGIIFLVISIAFGTQHDGLTGVSLIFPNILIGLICVGGLYFCIKGLIPILKKHTNINNNQTDNEPFLWKRVILITICATILIFLIEFLGFYTSSFLFVFCAFMLFSSNTYSIKKIVNALIFSGCLILSIWGLFHAILKVPTPIGIFL